MKVCLFIMLIASMMLHAQEWHVDNIYDWQEITDLMENLEIRKAMDWGGVIDLMN